MYVWSLCSVKIHDLTDLKEMDAIVTLDEETKGGCFYALMCTLVMVALYFTASPELVFLFCFVVIVV